MNTISKNLIINFILRIDEDFKNTPLRNVCFGFNPFKGPGLKAYRSMTVGEFLTTVAYYNRIPRPLNRIIESLISIASLPKDRRPILKFIAA